MGLALPLPLTSDKKSTSASHGGSSSRGSHRLASTACERLWAMRTVYGVTSVYDPPFRLAGTLVHTTMAYHYAAKMNPPPSWFKERSMLDALHADGEGHPDLVRLALQVYEAFKQRFAGDTWKPVSVEEEYRATIGELDPIGPDTSLDHEIVTCRTDLVVEANGDLWIVDHKASGGSSWGGNSQRLEAWKDDGEYALNWQVLMNLLILRTPANVAKLGGRVVRGFVIQRIKRKEPFDFDRHVLQIPKLAYQQASRTAREFVRKEREIVARIGRGEAPIPNFSMCYGRYGKCDYHDLCASDSQGTQATILKSAYRTRDSDPGVQGPLVVIRPR